MAKSERLAPQLTIAIVESIDGGFLAFVKELPGCIAQGDTLDEVKENILDVARAFLEVMLAEAGGGTAVPPQGKVLEERKYEVRPPELVPA